MGILYWPCSRTAKTFEENKVSRQISRLISRQIPRQVPRRMSRHVSRRISRRRQNVTSILITEYDRTIKAGWRKTCVGKGDLEVSFTDPIEEIHEVVLSEVKGQDVGLGTKAIHVLLLWKQYADIFFSRKGIGVGEEGNREREKERERDRERYRDGISMIRPVYAPWCPL